MGDAVRQCTRFGVRDVTPFEGESGQLRAAFDRDYANAIEEADRDADMFDVDARGD